MTDGETEEATQFLENSQNLFKVKFAKKSNGSKLVKLKIDDFQISWNLKNALKVDAVQVNEESSIIDIDVPVHKEEEEITDVTEETATIFTESPEAAKSGKEEAQAEEMYGNQLNGKPEYNTGKGITPEEQESVQKTDDPEEETLDNSYYRETEEANQDAMKVNNLSSGVVYEDILPHVDIEYVLKSQELKENIILKNTEAQNEFVFQMKINGLELVEKNGQVFFEDGDGNTVFDIKKPFAYDAAGEFTDKVWLGLVKGNGKKSELTVTVDREWLDAEERQFPVVIDPIVQTDQNANSIIDSYALSGYPDNNYYARPILKTGVDATAGVGRSFMRFALPQLKSGDMIVNATLNLYCYSTSTSSATVGAYQIMDTGWSSTGVTWRTQPVHQGEPEDYVVFTPETGKLVSLSITGMAKYWYENNSNGGVMIRSLQEDGQYVEYVSADYAIESMTARPSVLITYINNTGLEDYWSYHEQNVGRAGTGYVNDYNGNLVFIHQTAATTGNRMPIALSHVYNTNDKDVNLGYGYGWRLNYHQTIRAVQISGNTYYEYVDGDGTCHYFYSDNNKWKDESGIDLELTINSTSSDRYIIKDKQDNKLIFDASGKLIRITDYNNNGLTVAYTGEKIASITDGVGRNITCTYNSSGLLSSITGPSGSKSFGYSNSLLTTVTDKDNRSVQYTYNSLRAMTGAQDIDGYRISYGYTPWTPYRIQTVTEYSGSTKGQSFQIVRYGNRTRFTDNKGRSEDYAFNNFGNTISVKNEQGYAQSSKYFTEGQNKNKISKVSKLQSTVVNLLKNPNLESSGTWTPVQNNASATRKNDKTTALEGNYALYVTSSSTTGSAGYKQTVTLTAGKTYTFSVYVNTAEENLKNDKCVAQIKAVTSSGTLYSDNCDYYETESGWYRLMTSVTIPSGETVSSAEVYAGMKGVAQGHFDCFQLENSASVSRYNLIENGDFSNGTAGFTASGTNIFDRVVENGPDNDNPSVTYRRGMVTEPVLNMRSGPGTGYGIVTTATQGTYVTVVGEGTDSGGVTWYYTYVVKNGLVYSGYMISSYINFSSDTRQKSGTCIVDVANLNIRKGPGTGNTILVTIPRNTQVQLLDTVTVSNGQHWNLVYLTYGGTRYIGYALAEYIFSGYVGSTFDWDVMNSLDANVYQIVGNPSLAKKLTQTLNISGKAGDVYMGNLWCTGYPVTEKDSRACGLEVEFTSTDGTKEAYVSTFKSTTSQWQFLNDVFIPKKDYVKINVSCVYNYNCNSVLFDGLALYREDFAQSYIYDNSGNIISVAEQAKKESTFEYNGKMI